MSIININKALESAIANIEKHFGKGAIMALGDSVVTEVETISAGAPSLDRALGCGGYALGRIVEIFGPESSGKTTLALHAIAKCQENGGASAFIDAEHALDISYARKLGVNVETLLVSQPDTGEQALEIVETLVRSEAVRLIVIDSVAALVPKAELEGDMGDAHVGLQARLMSQALRKLTGIAHRSKTTIMFLNQLRSKVSSGFGSPETTTGGNALKYYASMRIDIRRIGAVKSGDQTVGQRARIKIVKNKLAPPFQQIEMDIRYGEGLDVLGDLIDTALTSNILEKNGSYYRFGDQSISQGRENLRVLLSQDAVLRGQIESELWSVLQEALPTAA